MTLVILCGGSTCNVALAVKMLSFRVTTVTGPHRNELRAKSFSGTQNQNSRGAQQSLIWGGGGGSHPRSNPLSFYIPFLTIKVPLSFTFY